MRPVEHGSTSSGAENGELRSAPGRMGLELCERGYVIVEELCLVELLLTLRLIRC